MTAHKWLAGKNVLVVENEWLIADDFSRSLSDEGAHVLGPVPSVPQALSLIYKTSRIDAAVLDIHLGDGANVYEVAELLHARCIPFIFATGYDYFAIRRDFSDIPSLTKPFPPSKISEFVAAASSTT